MTKKTICVDLDGVLNEKESYKERNLNKQLTGLKK